MYLKLFVCVLLVSHALAEEEDDGQYSPEKYEKPYEEVPSDEGDENQQPPSPVQQPNALNLGAYQQNSPQQTIPQGYQQGIHNAGPHGLPNMQQVHQAYNQIPQQPIVPQSYQSQPQPYQQNVLPQSYQPPSVVPQGDHKVQPQPYQQNALPQSYQPPSVLPQADKVHPQLYQQFLQQQKTLPLPQAYQQYAQHQVVPQYQDFSQQSVSQLLQNQVPFAYQQSTQQSHQDPPKPLDQSSLPAPVGQPNQQQIVPNSNDPFVSINQNSIPVDPQAPVFQQALPLVATNYETDNGHRRSENVDSEGNVFGQYSYVDPNGKTITVRYSAGKDGFKVEGDHLPVAPQSAVVPVADAPSIPQYNPQALSGSIQSQVNPTLGTFQNQGLHSVLQQNTAPSSPHAKIPAVITNSALGPQVPYNPQPQLQYSLQHLYGHATPEQTPPVSQYSRQQLYNQQSYPTNIHPQLKHNPAFLYNHGPQPGELLNSPQ